MKVCLFSQAFVHDGNSSQKTNKQKDKLGALCDSDIDLVIGLLSVVLR